MKLKQIVLLCSMIGGLLLTNIVVGQEFVKNLEVSPANLAVEFNDEAPQGYLLEIGGPGSYYWKDAIYGRSAIDFKNIDGNGTQFKDGQYTLQITPIYMMSDEDQQQYRALRDAGNEEGVAALREKYNIPEEKDFFHYNFRIHQGTFVNPDLHEKGVKAPSTFSDKEVKLANQGLYTSIDNRAMYDVEFTGRAWNPSARVVDQIFNDDLIVVGSGCFGLDCNNGESFGFDTVRLKENNLRIKFQDTSNSASFPTRDWQITANDSSNGGKNKFSIDDIDGGRTPFTIEASAPTNSLYVEDGGRIGFGTATPVVELHNVSGDSPTLRLEQNGSSGWTPQTWDIAGNETNFFVRDATNGSNLVFRIRVGAPAQSLYIDNDGDVGLGTAAPTARLDVRGSMVANAMSNASDKRYKKNITTFENALSTISQLRGVSYDWRVADFPEKNFSDRQQLGFIAQEIEQIIPEVVNTHDDGYKSVNYSKVTPILVEAIKEQQVIIDGQQEEIDALKAEVAQIAELKAQMAALAKLVKVTETAEEGTQVGEE